MCSIEEELPSEENRYLGIRLTANLECVTKGIECPWTGELRTFPSFSLVLILCDTFLFNFVAYVFHTLSSHEYTNERYNAKVSNVV